jgi:hypothetical protein
MKKNHPIVSRILESDALGNIAPVEAYKAITVELQKPEGESLSDLISFIQARGSIAPKDAYLLISIGYLIARGVPDASAVKAVEELFKELNLKTKEG